MLNGRLSLSVNNIVTAGKLKFGRAPCLSSRPPPHRQLAFSGMSDEDNPTTLHPLSTIEEYVAAI